MTRSLRTQRLTAEVFEPYGTVIEATGDTTSINDGTTAKFSNLAAVELDRGAQAALHIYRPQVVRLPVGLRALERHPLASQAFVPLGRARFVVVVAACPTTPNPDQLEAFLTNGHQGIQFATNVWHHPFLALEPADFLIVDRLCEDQVEEQRNLEMMRIDDWDIQLVD